MAKKKINKDEIQRGLSNDSAFFNSFTKPVAKKKVTSKPIKKKVAQSTVQLTSESTDKSTNQSIILKKPKAFYITKKQNKDLDLLVRRVGERLNQKLNIKIDRSTIIRSLLDYSKIDAPETAEALSEYMVEELIKKIS